MTIVLGSPKHRLLASAAGIGVLVAGLTAATFATAQEQTPRQGGAAASEPLPEITVQAPRTRRQVAAPAQAPQPAPQPPAPNQNSTMTLPPTFPGGQVARGGQVGVLGNLDYMNTPFSTTNFTQTFIENRQFTTIQDVMLSDPSVSFAQSGSRLANDYVKIRGFADYSGQDAAAVNGLVGVSSYYLPSPEFLSRLELIKGPNAFLNGAPGAVGGSINLVTKRASDKPILDITATYGSESQWGGIVDVGGRYGDNKQFGLRINAFRRDGDLQMRGYSGKQEGAAVGWDYRGERLRLDADLIYRNHIFYGDPYYSTLADAEMGLPQAPNPKINLTAPWMFMAAKALIAMTRAEFDLNDNWTIAAAYGHSKTDDMFNGWCFNTIQNRRGDATCGDAFGSGYSHSQYDRDAANLALRGNFVTGALKHRLVIGGNYIGEEQGSQPNLPAMPSIDFNIYNPVWPAAFPEPAFGNRNKQNTIITRGSFITHMVSTVDDRISVIGGLRRTQIDQTNFDIVTGQQLSGSSAAEVTPSIAGLIKITPWLALYGNYIEALERGGVAPPTAANAGQTFPALVSKQHEFGAKFDFQTLGATFAYYNINKANQYTDAATNIFTQNGRQENRGYEVTIFGEPIKGIRFVAGAAFIDAVQLQTDRGEFDGKKVTSVPDSEYRLAAEVDLPFVPGFTVTGAIYHTGPAPYDNANTFDVPSWTRFDLGARYVYYVDQVKMTARFNVENLTNEAYWIAGYGSGGLAQSGARRYVASLTASF